MTRRGVWAGAGVVVVAAIVWLTVAAHGKTPAPARGATASRRSGSMAGMAGMAATPASDAGSAKLTANQIRQFGVTFGTADVRALATTTRATGVVVVDETRLTQVTPKFGGFVERLYVNATGQPVQRGQPLLDVFSPELVAAQQELLLARQLQRELGRGSVPGVPSSSMDLVEASKRRLRLWDITEAQIDEIIKSGQPRRTLTLYAPAGGVVIAKPVIQGQSIAAGQLLYTIADLSAVWIDVQLRETDAVAAHTGTTADIQVTGLPGRTLKGRVSYVYPTLDSASRSIRARVEVSNPGSLLKPGMYVTAQLITPTRSALTVPNSAVLRTGERDVVFVDMGNGTLAPRDVEVGAVASDYTEVLSGLEPGQRVVTSAQFLLDSESNLADVMRSMIGQMSSGDVRKQQDMPGMPGMAMPAPVVPKTPLKP
ncbi:MAG TPA: efflux RND transporter periplasmic adaptor subunit [Gemmatimonadaceae bacterium]